MSGNNAEAWERCRRHAGGNLPCGIGIGIGIRIMPMPQPQPQPRHSQRSSLLGIGSSRGCWKKKSLISSNLLNWCLFQPRLGW